MSSPETGKFSLDMYIVYTAAVISIVGPLHCLSIETYVLMGRTEKYFHVKETI